MDRFRTEKNRDCPAGQTVAPPCSAEGRLSRAAGQRPEPLLCAAPMMGYTHRFTRLFLRLLSKHAVLFTEMIPAAALIHGDKKRFLNHDKRESPLVLQFGGGEPVVLAAAARRADSHGFAEINLNLGCPSRRVGTGGFGAVLMKTPGQAFACVRALCDTAAGPVSVKIRTGVDECDSEQYLCDFVGGLIEHGAARFYVHARKAWLQGLSPKQNRTVPPLEYQRVRNLVSHFPEEEFIINGGIETVQSITSHLQAFSGVMLGRALQKNPMLLFEAEQILFPAHTRGLAPEHGMRTGEIIPCAHGLLARIRAVEHFLDLTEAFLSRDRGRNRVSPRLILAPLSGVFYKTPWARRWRQSLALCMAEKTPAGFASLRRFCRVLSDAPDGGSSYSGLNMIG